MKKHEQIQRAFQILLWIWFGTITSFCATNVVNIAKLEIENKSLKEDIFLLKEKSMNAIYIK